MMSGGRDRLVNVVAGLMPGGLPDVLTAFARDIAQRHGDVVAVLAYGSCLRSGALHDGLIDFYVLTDGFEGVSGNAVSRLGCRLVPPNVYYAEFTSGGMTYRAKYAVLPVAVFERKVSARTANPYFWARFAQPCAIVEVRDAAARDRVVAIIATAVTTAVHTFRALAGDDADAAEVWRTGLQATYASELRSEGKGRAGDIVAANPAYYRAVTQAVPDGHDQAAVQPGDWRRVQLTGRILSVLRLIKASFTFQGGADYLAWKISRHSGQEVKLTPWQRRHPVLAAITLLPRLLRSGAVK